MFAAKDALLTRPSGGYVIPRSLRFRSSASAYLNRTYGTPTSATVWTFSTWLKRGDLKLGTDNNCVYGGSGTSGIYFTTTGAIAYYTGATVLVTGTPLVRDTSAHLHFCIVSNGTTVKTFVNNIEYCSYTGTISQFGGATTHNIGRGAAVYFDGYLSETIYVDGQALTPSSFCATSATTGVWAPIKYTGTYGANGFYLNYNSYATTAALGTDTSGNGNTWTVNNVSVTAGVTYDSMIDVPTVGTTGSNYCTLNPIAKGSQVTSLSEGNLKVDGWSGLNGDGGIGTMQFPTSGKWKYEVTNTGVWTGLGVGIYLDNGSGGMATSYLTSDSQTYGFTMNGGKLVAGVNTNGLWAAAATTDVITIIYDATNATLECKKNNTSMLTLTGIPAGNYFPYYGYNGGSPGTPQFTFGQRPFTYTDTGVNALNTYNLPAPTILKGNTVMDATLYTGTGASLSVTNAAGFQPDFVWVKSRSAATDHALYDSVRGVQKQIESNTTTAETTETTGLTAFGSGGFTVGALAQMNTSAATYVGWQWKGSGTTVSNTTGSITSTVCVNPTAGFSILTWTGTGANGTIGHGLGVAPNMVILFDRAGTNNHAVWHTSILNTQFLMLNSYAAAGTGTGYWNSTSPTSSVVSLGSSTDTNQNTHACIAYCFAPIAGYSAFGGYTGNGSTDGPFVFTGFRPRFVLLKSSSAATDWYIYDTARDTYNVSLLEVNPNLASAEQSNVQGSMDILSNGFKLRFATGEVNASGATYIYAAFAESPFKNSLAR